MQKICDVRPFTYYEKQLLQLVQHQRVKMLLGALNWSTVDKPLPAAYPTPPFYYLYSKVLCYETFFCPLATHW